MSTTPEDRQIVINTGPILALIAGTGSLDVLRHVYSSVHVPPEVEHEILVSDATMRGAREYLAAPWLSKREVPTLLSPILANTLDLGEASVIQSAMDMKIDLVCIDEAVGRRIARLNGLKVTGSLGVLVRAAQMGYPVNPMHAAVRMRENGIWVSDKVMSELGRIVGS